MKVFTLRFTVINYVLIFVGPPGRIPKCFPSIKTTKKRQKNDKNVVERWGYGDHLCVQASSGLDALMWPITDALDQATGGQWRVLNDVPVKTDMHMKKERKDPLNCSKTI